MYTLLRKIYISEVYDISPQCENLRIFPSQRFFLKKKKTGNVTRLSITFLPTQPWEIADCQNFT